MIVLDIDFSAIPKDKLIKAKNGHYYGKMCLVKMKQADKWGNTHTIYMQQSQEEREARTDRVYIGKAREYGNTIENTSKDFPF